MLKRHEEISVCEEWFEKKIEHGRGGCLLWWSHSQPCPAQRPTSKVLATCRGIDLWQFGGLMAKTAVEVT